jgi:S1-C subfamily serine protease
MIKRIAATVLFLTALVTSGTCGQSTHPDQGAVPSSAAIPVKGLRKDIPAISKAANGAIVSIVMSDKDHKPLAQGSGFVVSQDGIIVTNYHVIAQGTSAVIKLPDGAFYAVDGVLASDKARDIAVIKAHGQNFRTLTLGNSDRVQVGEEVVAIGNPLSLESTVSNGIVSGIRAVEEDGSNYLQITAPISPGSSGGPLFNMAGEVVGITTMYLKGGENLNFAVPINQAKPLLHNNISTLTNLPNEETTSEVHANGVGGVCAFLINKITESLPQVGTLCERNQAVTKQDVVSIFCPRPVLAGALRRAWSTALFQALQATAIEGPCQQGCRISISDSRMETSSFRYEIFVSRERQTRAEGILERLGGFRSDQGYLFEWAQLLNGTTLGYVLNENNAKSLGNSACQTYLQLLRGNSLLSDRIRNSPDNFPRLPSCSVMMTSPSAIYIVVDFPSNFMSIFSYFSEPLATAFSSLGAYDGAVIFRGPWDLANDGTRQRRYTQYSLHWLGFIHDEVVSGLRTVPESMLLLDDSWVQTPGQQSADPLFGTDAKPGASITRDSAVVRIISGVTHSQSGSARVQLTDGSEWSFQAGTEGDCKVSAGDDVTIYATKSDDGGTIAVLRNATCNVHADFEGPW